MMTDERLMKYIPKKIAPHITDCWADRVGYWAICERGYHFVDKGCHTAHGTTIKEFLEVIKSFREVNYEDDWD